MNLSKLNIPHPSIPTNRNEFKKVMQWIALLFAYAWWAVIIVFYGLLEQNVSLGYQFHSFPIIVVSLALVQILKLSMQKNKHLLTALATVGLFVSGLLA
jgi:FtsH-binding integral membrane protein